MNKRVLDLIMLSYNRKALLLKVLDRLKRQTLADFNLILTDDGSQELINPGDFPFIRRYVWDCDEGFHKVRKLNEAIAWCVSDKVLFLDDDCVPVHPTFLATHAAQLDQYDVSRGIISFPNGAIGSSWFSAANTGFRLEKLRAIGGFDIHFDGHYGHEDRDLGVRVKQARLTVSPLTEATTVVHMGTPYKDGDRSDAVIGENTRYFRQKWGIEPREATW